MTINHKAALAIAAAAIAVAAVAIAAATSTSIYFLQKIHNNFVVGYGG